MSALLVAVWIFVATLPLLAHHDPQAPVPSMRALKVTEPLTVDGVLDEPFWARCPVSSDLIDQRTQQRADQQTTVRIAYTHTHLYVAVECLDDKMDEVHGTERREDRVFTGDDWIEIHFDPGHTHRNKYAFFSNPLGTKADANEGPSGMFNYGWSAEWECAAKILTDRWVFEMKIPFTIMNYQRRNGQTWGFNVTRQLRRTDVLSFWSFNATEMYKPRHFGHLTGLDLADTVFDRNWEVTPYVSTRTDFNGDTDTFFRAGVDVGFRLTPSITTALTLRPDFGQVEADDDTIELRDTERFLPEKRLFFREGDERIRMPHRLYYSRRFSDIDAGLNTSGALDGLAFTFLNIYGDVVHDGTFHGNSSVLRVLQDVKERSNLGYYVADSELEGGHSRVLGADGYLFLTDAWRVSFQGAAADDLLRDEAGVPLKDRRDYLGHGSLIYSAYPWWFSFTYKAISQDFNPLLGYIPRRNIFGPSFFAEYYVKSDKSWYKELAVDYEFDYYNNDDGDVALRDHGLWTRVVFPNDLGLRATHQEDFHAPYQNRRTGAGFSLWTSDFWKSVNLGWAGGVFEETDYHELTLGKPLKFWERLPIRYEYVIRFEDRPSGEEDIVWLNRIVFDLFLAKDMWIKSSLQHRDNGIHNISVIYGWQPVKRTWWYLVFNNVNDGESEGNSIFSKVTYTF